MTPQKKIITSHTPLSPWPELDWVAYFDGEEELGGYGYGETEQAAISDLLEGAE